MPNLSLYDDKALLEAIARGDEDAFRIFYERYHPLLYAYGLKLLKLESLAEDLVHEVFLKIWEMRARLVVHSSLKAYLYRAARNQALNLLERIAADRELRRQVVAQFEAALDESLSRAARLEHYETLLGRSMAAMPAQRRKVFELVRLQGFSYEQAAAELGISRNTVKEHLVKALHFLRKDLLGKGDLGLLLILLEKFF